MPRYVSALFSILALAVTAAFREGVSAPLFKANLRWFCRLRQLIPPVATLRSSVRFHDLTLFIVGRCRVTGLGLDATSVSPVSLACECLVWHGQSRLPFVRVSLRLSLK